MRNQKIHHLADELFWYFQDNFPEARRGEYLSYKTNLVLAFANYINDSNLYLLAQQVGYDLNEREKHLLKKIINKGIEKYLADNIKTIALN